MKRARDRLSPAVLRRIPIDTLSVAVDRRAAQGDKETAIRTARAMIAAVPRSGKAHRFLVRSLLVSPFTEVDVREAMAAAEVMLALYEDVAVRSLYVDTLIAAETVGLDIDPERALAAFAMARPESRLPAVRRYLVHLVSAGRADDARSLALDLATSICLPGYWSAAHDFALRADRPDDASEIERIGSEQEWLSVETLAELASARHAHGQSFSDAAAELEGLRPMRSSAHSRSYVAALTATGRQAEVIDYLQNTSHGLPDRDLALARCEALFVLGRIDEARAALADEVVLPRTDIEVFRLLRDVERELGELEAADEVLLEVVRQLEDSAGPVALAMETPVRLYFELDQLDEIERILASPSRSWQLGPLGRYTAALTHYCRRRFDDALAEIDTLAGTIRHWEAEKLRGRILFELGDDEAALANRARFFRPDGSLDEVVYHSLLHTGDHRAAFEMYLTQDDRKRLERVFGDRAETDGDPSGVGSRAVIMQGGPGDEIQLASVIPTMLERCDHLVVVGDPRLSSLMRRSFPTVEFIASQRMRSRRHPGFLAPDEPPRARGELYDALTEEALHRLASVERVMFGRSLAHCSLLRSGATPAYLVPPTESAVLDSGGRPRVGLAWRSEFGSSMRSIHYATLAELDALLRLDVDFVCLQHDVTDGERAELDRRTSNPVLHPRDIDLRNDFDRTSALLLECDVVVGPGTTMTELAAACGRPTVQLQPTRFGTWRSKSSNGDDYWQAVTRIAAVADARDRSTLGIRAADLVRDLLRESAR